MFPMTESLLGFGPPNKAIWNWAANFDAAVRNLSLSLWSANVCDRSSQGIKRVIMKYYQLSSYSWVIKRMVP